MPSLDLDNYGKPRADYAKRLGSMTDDQLRDACNQMIWLSAYASNNPRSDYHWKCTSCFTECENRGKANIYAEEHKRLVDEAREG